MVTTEIKEKTSTGKYWDKAWSLVDGCTRVSEACDHCWLKSQNNRFKKYDWDTPIFKIDRLGVTRERKKPTVYSIWSDLFHSFVSYKDVTGALLQMYATRDRHTYLILTKRPGRMFNYFAHHRPDFWPLDNVWLGVTAENQEQANKRIPLLLETPAAHHFVSIEPMLGPIELFDVDGDIASQMSEINPKEISFPGDLIDLVILGGESGTGARPMHPDWARSVRDQCEAAGVPFFFKQHSRANVSNGRLLDGREHNDLPWRTQSAVKGTAQAGRFW